MVNSFIKPNVMWWHRYLDSNVSVLHLGLQLFNFLEWLSCVHKFGLHPFLSAPHACWQSHRQQTHSHTYSQKLSLCLSFCTHLPWKILISHISWLQSPLASHSTLYWSYWFGCLVFTTKMIISEVRGSRASFFITQSLHNRFWIIICWI